MFAGKALNQKTKTSGEATLIERTIHGVVNSKRKKKIYIYKKQNNKKTPYTVKTNNITELSSSLGKS